MGNEAPEAFRRLWDQVENDLGMNDCSMKRDRPYNGQPHTSMGTRGATVLQGITFRDLRDAYVRAVCQSMGANDPANMPYYDEAEKGEHAALCENDLYKLIGDADPMAVCQNLCCEIERLMGIYPNVPKLEVADD